MTSISLSESSPQNSPSAGLNWKVAVVLLAIAPPLAGFFWSMGPGFGQPLDYFSPMVMVVVFVCFVFDNLIPHRLGSAFLLAVFFNLAVTAGVFFSPALNDAMLAHGIHKKLLQAEKNLPNAPAISAELLPLLVDRPTVRASRSRLIEIRDSQTQPAVVTAYLADSEKFGVNSSFVRANGMVRPQDKAILENRVVLLAQQGHPEARVWLKGNATR